ncbi:nucleotidyltransferase family protein [Novispirillum itersonii]|uniref:MurNAc alpha-1-phosphate uridylyltransferase n=1 Tax=Novispirillum itersonii TaxID=189 RepID=A0A7W9ZE79_NOVIT|nr:nucleotidyltransferase family protein [Novispirillum itersonii]MBB6209785.1 MurNAc alpha-1-phosphate uridylyltransferase [Novispirillum itersonii]
MTVLPKRAMVLAAGLGTRMRPITDHTPKPLISVGGKTMLDRVLDHLLAAGVKDVVVNVHHHPGKIRSHLAQRRGGPSTTISDETERLLETGGGVRNALPLLGPNPFFVANADIIWLEAARPALERLGRHWRPDRMDALLLVKRTADAWGYDGLGDFFMDGTGVLRRRGEGEVAPYIYAGVMILKPDAMIGTPDGPFSLNVVFDRLLAGNRLYGVAHDGPWFHVGTPDSIVPTERRIKALLSGVDDPLADLSGPGLP